MAEKFGEEKKDKTAAEMRKINKPLMERKRRERINNCLNQLKMFLMETTKKDSSYYSKLEKADILELTVKYLKTIQRQQIPGPVGTDPKLASKYTAGYSQCANEVTNYLSKIDGFSPDLRGRLMGHITNCMQNVESFPSSLIGQGHSQDLSQGHSELGQSMLSLGVPSTGSVSHTKSRPDSPDINSTISLTSSPTSCLPIVSLPESLGGVSLSLNPQQQIQLQQQFQQPQQQQGQQKVPVLPVQLIPAKLPSGDMIFLMANTQSVQAQTNPLNIPNPLNVPISQTNPIVAPMSLHIPGANPATSSNANSGLSIFPLGGGTNVTPNTPSSVNPTNNASTSTITTTSVAVVQPNVHESIPSPSNIPTDLSMKSDLKKEPKETIRKSTIFSSSSQKTLVRPPFVQFRQSHQISDLPHFPSLPLNLQTHGQSSTITKPPGSPFTAPSTVVKPENYNISLENQQRTFTNTNRSHAGDLNNNNVNISSKNMTSNVPSNIVTSPSNNLKSSSQRGSPELADGIRRENSPVPAPPIFPGPQLGPLHGPGPWHLDLNQAGPGYGLGPMWRPW